MYQPRFGQLALSRRAGYCKRQQSDWTYALGVRTPSPVRHASALAYPSP